MPRNLVTLETLQIGLFADMPANELQQWATIATLHHLDIGDCLYRQGERANAFYIILAGGVRLMEFTPTGKVVTIKVYSAGDIFGLLALSQVHIQAATVEVVSPARVLAFRAEEARLLLQQNGVVAARLLAHVVEHVHHAHDRIRHLAAEKTEQRLARAVLHFHKKFGIIHEDIHVIEAEISQKDISEFTGTTIETVNRYLRDWEKRGWIRLAWKHIDILDPTALEAIAASVTSMGYLPE